VKRVSAQFVGFFLAGGIATVANFFLFLWLLSFGLHYLASASIGYVSGIGISFVLNRFVVYRSAKNLSLELFRYFLAYLFALIVQLFFLELLVRTGMDVGIANAIAIVAVVFPNFFVVRRFVFGHRGTPSR
jgi:putative flippase GtrA